MPKHAAALDTSLEARIRARAYALWEQEGLSSHWHTSVLLNGFLFGPDGNNSEGAGRSPTSLRCLDWKTGEIKWTEPKLGFNGLIAVGGKLLVLTETGGVYPCETLTDSFGNVRDFGYDMRQILRNEPARTVMRSIQDYRCHCTHECFMMTNTLFNPRLIGKIAMEYVKLKPAPTVQASPAPTPSPSH